MSVGHKSLVRRRRETTIAHVARMAGVSTAAVSLALNGKPGVAQGTRERIVAAADELRWRPSIGARSLLSSRAFAVGLILARDPELLGADPFYAGFIAGVESELSKHAYALVLQVVPDQEPSVVNAYRRMALEGRVDGIFLTDLVRNDPRLTLVQELRLPAIAVGRPSEPTSVPTVAVDDRAGVREAVAHLLELGHRCIAFVSGPPQYVHSRSRLAAWRSALHKAGVRPGPVKVADFTGAGGRDATKALLGLADRPTAVVFANDNMAIGGMAVALKAGVDVPREMSIVGFDDVPLAAHVHPPLTTVRQDALAWGRASAAALLSLIDQRELPVAALPPSQLVIRASTASPGEACSVVT